MRTYEELVKALCKPGEQIVGELTPEQAHMLHMAIGVAGEAGELLDAVKKHCIYQKPLDVENVIEELGDLEFYMEGLRQALDIDQESILLHNFNKLSKRYGNSYSNEAAQLRADKQSNE